MINIKQQSLYLYKWLEEIQETVNQYSDKIVDPGRFSVDDLMEFSIDSQISKIKSNEELNEVLKGSTIEDRKNYIQNTKNPENFEFIKQAKQNLNFIKNESLNICYLIEQEKYNKIQYVEGGEKEVNVSNPLPPLDRLEKNIFKDSIKRQIEHEKHNHHENIMNKNFLTQKDSVISINIYRSVDGQKDSEILMYQQQTLGDLKDIITCLQRDKGQKIHKELKTLKEAGFIFIEDVFYDDTRWKDLPVLSKVFLQKQKDINIKKIEMDQFFMEDEEKEEDKFRCAPIDTRLENLNIVIGKPYIFRHLEHCDHMIVFNDLRLWGPDLPQHQSSYPLRIFMQKFKRRFCQACNQKYAIILTFFDRISDTDINSFCQQCYDNLHLDENGLYRDQSFYIFPYYSD